MNSQPIGYVRATIYKSSLSGYGSILKNHSQTKITRKLKRTAAHSVSRCTNIGNKYREVSLSLLTTYTLLTTTTLFVTDVQEGTISFESF
jgi:hypothetical protein